MVTEKKLRGGQTVKIRPLRKEDLDLELDFFRNLSPESRNQRFLGGISTKNPPQKLIDMLLDIDHFQSEAYIALAGEGEEQKQIGVARYAVDAGGSACECAAVVADEWQRRGLGTLLMNLLIDSARDRGIKRMYTIESAGNAKVRKVARTLGFRCEAYPGDPTLLLYNLDLQQE
ncbi:MULTISPECIES: GNAT family N-acetyltransferase [unclassified Microbulbifer]|uniref:GNAT family N-acetyltransferase n=1 Tax=unclassified Microbulbifer TaxID=2619833 RepID=UPI0027E53DEA|nr:MULTISPECIES: GNAT family N-acetyltransferase [unclassified Microbulbifer]